MPGVAPGSRTHYLAAMPFPTTLHDILVAWQAGELGYRDAMRLAGADTLDGLYDAAHLSGVPIRPGLNPEERAQGKVAAPLLRAAARPELRR